MTIEILKNIFSEKILTVTVKNHFEIYCSLESDVKTYRAEGGLGKVLYEFLWIKYFEFENNEMIQDIFGDIMSKMSGHCSPGRDIEFKDVDFKLFNRETGKFI